MSNKKSAEPSSSEEESDDEQQIGRARVVVQQASAQERPSGTEELPDTDSGSETESAEKVEASKRGGGSQGEAPKVGKVTGAASKRTREEEAKDEDRQAKKSKEKRGDVVRPTSAGPLSPSKVARLEVIRPMRGSKAAQGSRAKSDKENEEEAKGSKASKKRKPSPPDANGKVKLRAEASDGSPARQSAKPFSWSNSLELHLVSWLKSDKKGSASKNDPYWAQLQKLLASEGVTISATQISEKVRRLKKKWKALKEQDETISWKNEHDRKLFIVMEDLWGGEDDRQAGLSQTQAGRTEEDGEEEEEEDDVAVPADGRQPPRHGREEELSDSDEEDDSEDEKDPHHPTVNTAAGDSPFGLKLMSPFASKPRLIHTPMPTKQGSKNVRRVGSPEANHAQAQRVKFSNPEALQMFEVLKRETFTVLEELRTSCLEAVDDIRKQSAAILESVKDANSGSSHALSASRLYGSGNYERGLLDPVLLKDIDNGTLGSINGAAGELKKRWRQLRIDEMEMAEKRIQFTLKQLQVARKEIEGQG